MKNIIPFKKDVIFKTNISEITSISLEHTLSIEKEKISGDFIINGEYKISDNSSTVEPFDLKIPFEISLDERFDTDKATLDIDDFFYEIINNSVLSLSIDVLVDKLEEKQIIEEEIDKEPEEEIKEVKQNMAIFDDEQNQIIESVRESKSEDIKTDKEENREKEITEEKAEEKREEVVDVKEKIDSLFNKFSSDNEVFVTYSVCIIREGDTIESVLEKYGISEDLLREYNNLKDLKIGDKLIIPNINETN